MRRWIKRKHSISSERMSKRKKNINEKFVQLKSHESLVCAFAVRMKFTLFRRNWCECVHWKRARAHTNSNSNSNSYEKQCDLSFSLSCLLSSFFYHSILLRALTHTHTNSFAEFHSYHWCCLFVWLYDSCSLLTSICCSLLFLLFNTWLL